MTNKKERAVKRPKVNQTQRFGQLKGVKRSRAGARKGGRGSNGTVNRWAYECRQTPSASEVLSMYRGREEKTENHEARD